MNSRNRRTRFITKGRGRNRRVIPIGDRRKMPERWRETGVVAAAGRPMNMSEIERRAEVLALDSRPVKEFGSALKAGVYISPNDGSFEKFARDKGKDVIQLDPEGFVDWDECEILDLSPKGVDVKGEE